MKKIWLKKARSYKEMDRFERRYYLSMPRQEKLGLMQLLREIYLKINPDALNASRKGLRRVIKVIQ